MFSGAGLPRRSSAERSELIEKDSILTSRFVRNWTIAAVAGGLAVGVLVWLRSGLKIGGLVAAGVWLGLGRIDAVVCLASDIIERRNR